MWTFAGRNAVYSTERLRVVVDLDSTGIKEFGPSHCPELVRLGGGMRLLQLVTDLGSRSECYSRGHDVVVKYSRNADQVAYEVYWRFVTDLVADRSVHGIELIISAETNQLHCSPLATVQSSVPDGTLRSGDRWFAWEFEGQPLNYLELVHPSNHHHSAIEMHGMNAGSKLAHQLFPGSLEKGVIRRARLRCCLTPNPAETAASIYRQFVDSTPPLTT